MGPACFRVNKAQTRISESSPTSSAQRRQVKHQSKLRSEFVSDSLHNTNPDPDLPLSKPPAIGINAQMKPPLPSSPPESYLGPAQAEETASTPKFKPSSWGSAVWGGGGVCKEDVCQSIRMEVLTAV